MTGQKLLTQLVQLQNTENNVFISYFRQKSKIQTKQKK